MITDDSHFETAEAYRENREFTAAGDSYTVAAYEDFGEDVPKFPATVTSRGEYKLLLAAVCYRLAGAQERCINRCKQGILIAQDMNTRHLPVPEDEYWFELARRGVWYEYIGDFRLVAELDGANEAYCEAKRIYQLGRDPETGSAEQEHKWLLEFYERVAQVSLDDDEWRQIKFYSTFTEWVDYKQARLSESLEKLTSQNEWPL